MGCLTVYTDASYSTETKVAGYGFWARDKAFLMRGGGAEANIRCNTAAEIRAIAYALYRLEQQKLDHVKDKLYCTVVTDSQVAIEYYLAVNASSRRKLHKLYGKEPYNFVINLMTKYNITFNIKWVKAHSTKDGARSWVNSHVDTLAKEARVKKELDNEHISLV